MSPIENRHKDQTYKFNNYTIEEVHDHLDKLTNKKGGIMPATVAMRNGKWRVVEADSGHVVRRNGTSVDGGGYDSKEKAQAQAKAINANS